MRLDTTTNHVSAISVNSSVLVLNVQLFGLYASIILICYIISSCDDSVYCSDNQNDYRSRVRSRNCLVKRKIGAAGTSVWPNHSTSSNHASCTHSGNSWLISSWGEALCFILGVLRVGSQQRRSKLVFLPLNFF